MGLANNSLSKYLLDSRLKKFYVQYVHNSMYYKYSKNYIDAFPKKQILIIDFNDKKVSLKKFLIFYQLILITIFLILVSVSIQTRPQKLDFKVLSKKQANNNSIKKIFTKKNN